MTDIIRIDELVNNKNVLPSNFVPDDLVIMDNNENNFHLYDIPSLKPMISKRILPDFLAMQKAAKKDGLNIIVDSGYRSYEWQAKILKDFSAKMGEENARKRAALPGASEHQTGLAFDVACIRDGKYFETENENDLELVWLIKNSYKFGFILRYPKDKEAVTGYNFEPWHYRYVEKDLAKYLYDHHLTLEEYYYEKLGKNKNE